MTTTTATARGLAGCSLLRTLYPPVWLAAAYGQRSSGSASTCGAALRRQGAQLVPSTLERDAATSRPCNQRKNLRTVSSTRGRANCAANHGASCEPGAGRVGRRAVPQFTLRDCAWGAMTQPATSCPVLCRLTPAAACSVMVSNARPGSGSGGEHSAQYRRHTT